MLIQAQTAIARAFALKEMSVLTVLEHNDLTTFATYVNLNDENYFVMSCDNVHRVFICESHFPFDRENNCFTSDEPYEILVIAIYTCKSLQQALDLCFCSYMTDAHADESASEAYNRRYALELRANVRAA